MRGSKIGPKASQNGPKWLQNTAQMGSEGPLGPMRGSGPKKGAKKVNSGGLRGSILEPKMAQNRSKNASQKRKEKQPPKKRHRAPFWTILGGFSEAFWSQNGVDGDLGSILTKKAAYGSYIVNPNEKSRFTGSEGTENRRRVDILGGKSGLKHGTATKGGQNSFWNTFWSILGSIWEAKTIQKLVFF